MKRTLTDVPAREVDRVVRDFRSEGAEVEKMRQRNGLWTVIATFPDPAVAPAAPGTPSMKPSAPRTASIDTMESPPDEAMREGRVFPLHRRPDQDYHTGSRRFGADRRGGRKHAGCDLIAPEGTEILAMADGRVIRGPYLFYSGTYALEVKQDDGRVVRYGEIQQLLPSGVEVGAPVSCGQVIARVGRLDSGSSMLHLEMYEGTQNGSLTQAGNQYKRRADLIDPTPHLDGAPLLGERPQDVGDGQQPMDRWVAALLDVETSGASAATASQDGLEAGIEASHQMAETDLPRVGEIAGRFADVAGKFGVPAAVLAALASRESRCGAALQNGWGDNGNAFGILQVDKRFHRIEGEPDPTSVAHIEQAAGIFNDYLEQVMRRHPQWNDPDLLKGAAVAYNSGVGNVQTVAGMDRGTTGNDYGADVMARAQYYFDRPELSAFRA